MLRTVLLRCRWPAAVALALTVAGCGIVAKRKALKDCEFDLVDVEVTIVNRDALPEARDLNISPGEGGQNAYQIVSVGTGLDGFLFAIAVFPPANRWCRLSSAERPDPR